MIDPAVGRVSGTSELGVERGSGSMYFNEALPSEFWAAVGLAAAAGAVGGFIAELLTREAAGRVELPRRLTSFYDFGFLANIFIGAVAAVALSLLTLRVDIPGTDPAVTGFSATMLIGTGLVAGSAGGAIISALQSRVSAALAGQTTENLKKLVDERLAALEQRAPADGNVSADIALLRADIRAVGESVAPKD